MRAGAFPDGRLPPEAELAGMLGVSRATVRAALQTLAEDGVVSRRRRHGTLINEHVLRGGVPLNRLLSFRDLIEQSGFTPAVDPRVPRVTDRVAEDVAAALGLAPGGEPCLVVERLLRADGRPVVTITDTLPLRWLQVMPEDVPETDSTFSFVAACTGATVDHSLVTITPAVATGEAPRHLDVPAGTPYTALTELLFSPLQEPVALSRIAVDSRHLPLTLVRRGI